MERIRLHSRITILYKLILPLIWIAVTLLMLVVAIALNNESDAEAFWIILAFFVGFFVLFLLPPMFVCKVTYDHDNMHVHNFRNEKTIPLKQVNKVNRWMFYFYRIGYTDEVGNAKRVLLLPSFEQRFEAMMGMPEDLERFEEIVSKP